MLSANLNTNLNANSLKPASLPQPQDILETASKLRWEVSGGVHEALVEAIYTDAARIADRAVIYPDKPARFNLDRTIDQIVTSRLWGFPMMLLLFTIVFWLTIAGANVPSGWLAYLLLDLTLPVLHNAANAIYLPWWLSGLLIDGIYLATAWVISVMLPPMAIFFPLFTLLEDFGYLPRVAFNLDNIFKKSGAHGKQALSMMMGFGCNGRWPTQILIATLFIGGLVPSYLGGLISALSVVGIATLGVFLSFAVSWSLSRTVLRGEASTFSLELPPYRPPQFWQTLYTSLIDRTLYVLWRAIVFAAPAGALIWLSANIQFGGVSVAEYLIQWMNPVGWLFGLNGVILLAYIVAIPANEIVIPTVLMLTVLATGTHSGVGAGVMFEASDAETLNLLHAGGWTLLTAVNLMLFSLLHNPCSTTIYTIYKETGSAKWAAVSALLPLAMGFVVTFVVAQVWRLVVGV